MSTPRKLLLFSKQEIKAMRSAADSKLFSQKRVLSTHIGEDKVVIKRTPINKKHENECEKEDALNAVRGVNHELDIFMMTNNQVPNIVECYGGAYYKTKNHICFYIITSHMPNGDLFHYIHKNSVLDWGTRLSIMQGITSGISYLHEREYVHDDIKSLNVLLDANYQAKLCDFESTEKIGRVGSGTQSTVGWRAPELFDEENDKSFASDIYSLASVFWELASWKHIDLEFMNLLAFYEFLGSTPDDESMKLRGEIPDDCLPKVADLITWGWQRDQGLRPSIQEVGEVLRGVKVL